MLPIISFRLRCFEFRISLVLALSPGFRSVGCFEAKIDLALNMRVRGGRQFCDLKPRYGYLLHLDYRLKKVYPECVEQQVFNNLQ